MSFADLDRTLGSVLKGAQRSTPPDAERVILSVLASSRGTHPEKTVRAWLRSRGNTDVRIIASSARAFRALSQSSSRYRADYSPEGVRSKAARRVTAGLTFGLPAGEAALLAAIALDQMESGLDGTLLHRVFDVNFNLTRNAIMNRARNLASRGLLTIASVQTGVTTRVRLRSVAPTTGWTPELRAFEEALKNGEATPATMIFNSVLSPAFGYWRGQDNERIPVDGWYVALLDTLGIRTQVLPAPRASRVRRTLRELGFSADLARFSEDLEDFETPDVLARHDNAEAERSVSAAERTAILRPISVAKRVGWDWANDDAPIPRRDTTDKKIEACIPGLKLSLADAIEAQTEELVRRALPEKSCDALEQVLRQRQWDADRIARVIDAVFPDRSLHRVITSFGAFPKDRADLPTWAKQVASLPPRADETLDLRAYASTMGFPPLSAARAFPFHALRPILKASGAVPRGGPDNHDAAVAWMREVQRTGRAPAELTPLLRIDLEAAGWDHDKINAALPRITKED